MRKLLCIVISITMVFLMSTTAFADELKTDTSKMTKAEFAEYCNSLNKEKTRCAVRLSNEDIDNLLYQYAISNGTEKDAYELQLNSAGIYIYKGSKDDVMLPYYEPEDVNLSGVVTSYDGNNGTWALTAGGYWKSINPIAEDLGSFNGYVGMKKNVGGFDAVGIVLYDTTGTTPSLVNSYGSIHNGHGTSKTLNNPSSSNTRKGISFEYQDYAQVTEANMSYNTLHYMGYGFSATMKFNSAFENFHGMAKGFYAHTWQNTSIDSIGFNGSKTNFGLNVSWSAKKNKMLIFSNMDTDF